MSSWLVSERTTTLNYFDRSMASRANIEDVNIPEVDVFKVVINMPMVVVDPKIRGNQCTKIRAFEDGSRGLHS